MNEKQQPDKRPKKPWEAADRPPDNIQMTSQEGAYQTQAISSPDSRDPQTNMAIPDEHQVLEGKEWVDFNKK